VTLLGRGMGDFKQDDDDDENDDEGHGGGGGGGYVEGERNRSRGTNSKSSANVTVKRDAKGELDDGFDDEDDEDSDSENDEMPFFGLSMGDAWDDTGDYNNKQSNLSNNLAAGETALPKNILKAVGSALQELSHLASTVPTLPWLDWADAPPLPSHDAVSSGAWAPWAEPAELGQPGQAQGGSGFLMTFGKGDHGKLGHGWGPLPVSTSSSAVKAMSATGAGPDQAAPPNLNAPAAVRGAAFPRRLIVYAQRVRDGVRRAVDLGQRRQAPLGPRWARSSRSSAKAGAGAARRPSPRKRLGLRSRPHHCFALGWHHVYLGPRW
jgi:hypothetical protein